MKIVPLLISIGILLVLLYFSDINRIFNLFLNVNIVYIAFAIFLWVITACLRTFRWIFLLKKVGIDIDFSLCFKILVSGLFLSNLTPGKIGDPLRSVLLKRVCNAKISITLPSLILERLSDVLAMMCLSLLGFIFFLKFTFFSIWFYAVLLYLFIFFLCFHILRSEKWIGKLALLFRAVKDRNKIKGFYINIHKSIKIYKKKEFLGIVFLSLLIWLIESFIIYIAFVSLGFYIPYLLIFSFYPLAILISILTFLPGGLGSVEVALVSFLSAFLSSNITDLTAGVILGRMLTFWVYTLLGVIFLISFNIQKVKI